MLYDYFKQRKIGLFFRFVFCVNIYRNISPDIETPGFNLDVFFNLDTIRYFFFRVGHDLMFFQSAKIHIFFVSVMFFFYDVGFSNFNISKCILYLVNLQSNVCVFLRFLYMYLLIIIIIIYIYIILKYMPTHCILTIYNIHLM